MAQSPHKAFLFTGIFQSQGYFLPEIKLEYVSPAVSNMPFEAVYITYSMYTNLVQGK